MKQQISAVLLARTLFEVRFENVDMHGWEGLTPEVRQAYIAEAETIIKRMDATPAVRRIAAFATRSETEMTFKRGFDLGVEYAMPSEARSEELQDQVQAERDKQSNLWMRTLERA